MLKTTYPKDILILLLHQCKTRERSTAKYAIVHGLTLLMVFEFFSFNIFQMQSIALQMRDPVIEDTYGQEWTVDSQSFISISITRSNH